MKNRINHDARKGLTQKETLELFLKLLAEAQSRYRHTRLPDTELQRVFALHQALLADPVSGRKRLRGDHLADDSQRTGVLRLPHPR